MCCKINIVCSISLKIGVNVHERYRILIHAGIGSRRWTMLCAYVIGVSISCEIVTFDLTPPSLNVL